jgi:hypothetical protein
MFTIRFTNGMTRETVYSCYAYSVARPAIYNEDHPMVTMALSLDVDPIPTDPRAINFAVTEAAFIMNETGKTIDRIISQKQDKNILNPSVFQTRAEAVED